MAGYNAFAWFYNRHWGGFAKAVMPVLEHLVLKSLAPPAEILDLCCGSGQLASLLTDRGYRVTGVDQSQELLEFATQNAPAAEFICADVRELELHRPFDAAFCTFDSLNHMMTRAEFVQGLAAAFEHLRSGSHFLFDLNTDASYAKNWRGSFAIMEADSVCAARSSYAADDRLATLELALFRLLDDAWQRQDITLHQRCYEVEDVVTMLAETGFEAIAVYDGDEFSDARMSAGRAFFHCKKP